MDDLAGGVLTALGMLGAIIASGFFSGAETALFSLSRLDLRTLRDSPSRSRRMASRLREKPRRLLVTILLGNLVINVTYYSLAADIVLRLAQAGHAELGAAVSVVTLAAHILLGELAPKALAMRRPVLFATVVSVPLDVVMTAILPVRFVLSQVARATSRIVGGPAGESGFLTPRELGWLVERGGEEGRLLGIESRMIREVLEFGELRVREVMTPRVDLLVFDAGRPREDLVARLAEHPTPRVLLHRGDVDEVTGYLDGRDLLFRPEASPEELSRTLRIVPESKPVEALLGEMRSAGFDTALVVDEYGGTEGMVTLEDLVEEIVGEIADELEEGPVPLRRLGDGSWRASGAASMRDLAGLLGADHPREDVDTIGGYVTARLGRVAHVGDVVLAGVASLTVEKVRGRRVRQVLIETGRAEPPWEAGP